MIRTLLPAATLAALVGVGTAAMPSDAMARGPKMGRCTNILEEIKRADCINALAAAAATSTSTDSKPKKATKTKHSASKKKKTKKPS